MSHLLRSRVLGLLACYLTVTSSLAMAQTDPYVALWNAPQANGDIRVLLELNETDFALFAEARTNDPFDVQLVEKRGITVTGTSTFVVQLSSCIASVGCFFEGPFRPRQTYKLMVSEDASLQFIVACDSGGISIASLERGSCVPKQAFFERLDPQYDLSSLSIEGVGAGQFKVFLNPLYGLNLEAVFAPNSKGFALASSNADIKMAWIDGFSLSPIDSNERFSPLYPISFSLETGLSTVQGFDVIEFKLKPEFMIGIPYSDVLITEFHKLTGTVRDRYPALFSVSYEFKPTLVNNDLFYVTTPVHNLTFDLFYNIPLAQSFDVELKWRLSWDLLALRLDLPSTNDIGLTFKWYFSGQFDDKNHLKAEVTLRPNASLLNPAFEIHFSLLTTIKSLADLLTTPK
jgi:hypothetical protein